MVGGERAFDSALARLYYIRGPEGCGNSQLTAHPARQRPGGLVLTVAEPESTRGDAERARLSNSLPIFASTRKLVADSLPVSRSTSHLKANNELRAPTGRHAASADETAPIERL